MGSIKSKVPLTTRAERPEGGLKLRVGNSDRATAEMPASKKPREAGHRETESDEFIAELAKRGDPATRRRIAKRYAEFMDGLAREELARMGAAPPANSKELGSFARAKVPAKAPAKK